MILFGALAESIAQTEIETIDVSLSNDLTFSVGQMHSPEAQNYFQGGIYWFAIPFSFATSLGLATTALMLPLNMNEAGSGLVPPAVTDDYLLGDAMNEEPSNFLRLGGLTIASGGVLPNIHTSSTSTLEAGRFPTLLSSGKDMQEKIDEVKGLNVAAPAASLTASSLGKQWQNIGQMYYIKSTMGPPQQIYF